MQLRKCSQLFAKNRGRACEKILRLENKLLKKYSWYDPEEIYFFYIYYFCVY